MDVQEFSDRFDILYNGIANNSAPALDAFEKSYYLSKAQLQLVLNYFNPKGNKYQTGFEGSTIRRGDLKNLIVGATATAVADAGSGPRLGLNSNSQFATLNNDILYIIQEQAKVSNATDTCYNNTYIKVKPVTHDEYNIQIENPFKKPDNTIIWRLDYQSTGSGSIVELIPGTGFSVAEYAYRYIKFPDPIILVDLATTFPSEGLMIDGVTAAQTSALSEGMHERILDRAVELASTDYKPERLAVKTQINQRNE
jgi:hypothetical protein